MRYPLDLFQAIIDECRESDVAAATTGSAPANFSDFVRLACTLTLKLLQGPTRARVLGFMSLPDDRMDNVLSHLGYRFGADWNRTVPPFTAEGMSVAVTDEMAKRDLEKEQEGIQPLPDDEAPLNEPRPWDQF